MADALCGPSNSLQTFQKQTTVDRTLQQDRLAARQPQAESFRSIPEYDTGVVDAEFEAFQAGRPLPAPYVERSPFSYNGAATPFRPNLPQHTPTSSNWASDFQNLNLNETRAYPIPQSEFHQHAPLHRSKPSDWHEDFVRQQNHSPATRIPTQQYSIQQPYGFPGQQYASLPPLSLHEPQREQTNGVFDEAAFEKAFENARLDSRSHQQETQLDQDIFRTKEAGAKLMNPKAVAFVPNAHRIGSDRVLDEAEERKSKNMDEPDSDELARTAGQLLENVKGDQSRKFQESNFLSLMRQLRDKEVRVEGDQIVDVSMPSDAV